jgi:hypothetical protein
VRGGSKQLVNNYGYRRIDAPLHREAMAVNRKRVLRVMRDVTTGQPSVPAQAAVRAAGPIGPNVLAGGLQMPADSRERQAI